MIDRVPIPEGSAPPLGPLSPGMMRNNAVYAAFFPGTRPARSGVQVGQPKPGARIEIAAIAHLRGPA